MSSSVFFKFKSQKEPSRVTFDGTGISVFELKRAIIETSGLGDGTDFDLAIYNEDSNEEYNDDTSIIARSTSIIARRLPPARPGFGSGARYVSGKMPVNARNSSRTEKSVSKPAIPARTQELPKPSNSNGPQSEEEKIAAMFQADSQQWDKQQQEMANATPVFRGGARGKPSAAPIPSHPPPSGYICYRCGEKGHWIQECPTNNDPEFDNRPRVKRTTGIPRSFLKTVQKPTALTNDGLTDDSRQPSGVMVNADGDWVVAEPDKASWDQFQAKTKVSAAAQEAAKLGNKELQERGLECPIDKKMFVEPTKTPCCEQIYCNECIVNALIESDLICPGCQTEGILLDTLKPDDEVAEKIKKYVDEKDAEKLRGKGSPKSPVAAGDKLKADKETSSTKANSPTPANRSLTSTPSAGSSTNSKKRAAEEPLPGPPPPKAPAAMRKQQSGQGLSGPPMHGNRPNPNNSNGLMPNGMPMQQAFPNLPMNMNMNMNPMNGFPNAGNFMGMPVSMSMGPMMGMGTSMMDPMAMMSAFGPNPGFPNPGMNFPQQNGMYGPGAGAGANNGNNNNRMNPGMIPNMNGMFGQMPTGMPMPMPMPGAGGMGMNLPNMAPMPNLNINMHANGMPANPGNPLAAQQAFAAAAAAAGQPFVGALGDDNAYFRQPVNPQRHQARQRRMRPSDYHEL